VWSVCLCAEEALVAEFREVLSPDERARADRFLFRKDRDAFTITRAALRHLLGSYTDQEPACVRFGYGPQGKPHLADISRVRFNVSHSHHLALIAVALEREIGVDVEFVRSLRGDRDIPEHFFSSREVAALRALPEDRQEEAFFDCWTRKEAFIKAKGGGLSIPLDRFDVSLEPGRPAALLEVRGEDPNEAEHWGMRELHVDEGYAAALVCEGKNWEPQCGQWSWAAGEGKNL
jgi:4'-phosphopantetheinyl transferase